jgi:uncharacterized protein YxeA
MKKPANLQESTSERVITESRGDSPYREVVSLLGKSGGGKGSRNNENLLFIVDLFQLGELALCMLYKFAGISNTPSERGNKMKKILSVVMAVAFAFSVAGFAVAADNAAKPVVGGQNPAAVQKGEQAAPAAKKAAKAAKGQKVTGTIEALDAAAGTFTVKGKKETVDLKAGEKVKLDSFKVGDKVVVKYADGTASSVKAMKAAKAEKKAKKAAEKDAKPAAAPAAPAGN